MSLDLPGGAAASDHGGDLAAADALFPFAPKPWLDLSTGINPHSYPFAMPPQTAFARLPEPAEARALAGLAAELYGAPSTDHVVAAPGTQILLPPVMSLRPGGRAAVLGPTYAEHARAALLAGHDVSETNAFAALFDADLAVVVNPNNPDGRIVPRERLLDLARHLGGKGGLLVVDEAFIDVGPAGQSLAGAVEEGSIVVLRSFGKFFGLAGIRLGFAIAGGATAERLAAQLGPWAVAGPALAIGRQALADRAWQAAMRVRLRTEADALDAALAGTGLDIAGGTSLFRLVQHTAADTLYAHLGRQGILTRRFSWRSDILRIGLPGSDTALARLDAALKGWKP